MKSGVLSLACVALCLLWWPCGEVKADDEEQTTPIPIGDCVGRDEELRTTVTTLARQMMLQQLFVEEKSRSDGDSGLKAVRQTRDGTQPYHVNSHMSHSVASIHDHADHEYTVGMGELLAVLNGVEFRTRHNDYSLYKPSTTSSEYHASERIEYPDVPPEVLNKGTVQEQIEEMREWVKAWLDESTSPRDYRCSHDVLEAMNSIRSSVIVTTLKTAGHPPGQDLGATRMWCRQGVELPYFRPQLCYMEGAWTSSDDGELEEPFESDRHFIDAKSWFDLQEKIRYTAYHGSKDNGENLAYLPTTIISINETTGVPVFAQFTYRIICHPVQKDIPLSYFRPSGDLHTRYANKQTLEEYMKTRSARYSLSDYSSDKYHRWNNILDEIMSEIPGKDNYGAWLTDETFGLATADVYTQQTLNSAYYHRWYLMQEEGAMGSNIGHRGFNDRALFVAENTRPEVAGITYNYCPNPNNNDNCILQSKKVSYAFPLEIVYLTPLNKWNPYNLVYKGPHNSPDASSVTANGRNGGFDPSDAFNGTHSKVYYQTPSAFYGSGGEVNSDAADTLKAFIGVLDGQGNVQNVTASGIRIHLPAIPGIPGNVRTRYPIMPIYGEGSTVWKELEALRTMIMDVQSNIPYFEKDPGFGGDGGGGDDDEDEETLLYTSFSQSNRVASHRHYISVVDSDENAGTLVQTTSVGAGHAHVLTFSYNSGSGQYVISACDGNPPPCWDGHTAALGGA